MDDHVIWMRAALEEARLAAEAGDIPVGAVAVYQGHIIGRGRNRKEVDQDPTAHAEIMALREAAQALRSWRLIDVTLYCTLEPCAMCAGAMVQARLSRLIWATDDPKAGAGGSIMDLLQHPQLNHVVIVESGILAEEAQQQLKDFFAGLRAQGKK
ncbi:MAG: tRNA adenosine(34) deaminase TadA [Chloroflexi bacterium]|nr:tRNA adenosine(34) deaminase TadA [Chloroflexota bacterium]